MREFIDKTRENPGTKINRRNLMAVQGFEQSASTYGKGKRTVTFDKCEVLTTYFSANSVINTLTGEKTITKTTRITDSGNIEEELS